MPKRPKRKEQVHVPVQESSDDSSMEEDDEPETQNKKSVQYNTPRQTYDETPRFIDPSEELYAKIFG